MRPVLDLRGLDPPEPLVRIFEALDADGAGPHVFLLAREPFPLYALLLSSGWRHTSRRVEAGCEVTVFRAASDASRASTDGG